MCAHPPPHAHGCVQLSKAVSASGAGIQQQMEEMRGAYPGAPSDAGATSREQQAGKKY